jgi:pimeloyl-ACP methyl ester carboxylesterase
MMLLNKLLLLFVVTIISISAAAEKVKKHPASTTELTINSHGKRMSGFIYLAAGEAPHPTVLLLHGYPGNEKNLDLAQALRSKGWNVAFFHYRGAWGSEGEFSFRNAEQDVQVVLKYLSNKTNAKKLRIDRNLISTVGHSMGGHMAIAGILDNPLVNCSVALDGANLGAKGVGFINDPSTSIPWKAYGDTLFMLNGWSGDKAQKEVTNFAKSLDLVTKANKINSRPVLLIGADTDVIPMDLHIKPLLAALKATKNSQAFYTLIDDDHSFSSSRKVLINTTTDFLEASCKVDNKT